MFHSLKDDEEVSIMCEGTELLERLKSARPRVLDDEVLAYGEKLKKNKAMALEFFTRVGLLDENGDPVQLVSKQFVSK